MLAKSGKLKRYEDRIEQFKQNRIFGLNQKKFYDELNKSSNFSNDMRKTTKFWGDIWSVEKEHNRTAVWLKELKKEIDRDMKHTQDTVKINTEKVKKQSRKLPNWKAPGPDGVQGYWLKHFTALHERIASQLDGMLTEEEVLQWTTHGRTVLCQKNPQKGTAVDNHRPITCLPLMWRLLTGIVAEEMYQYLEQSNILPDEQKGWRRRSRGTKDQLLIDRTILRDCKKRLTNLSISWIDYRKAYDLVPQSWISECMEMFGIAENVRNFLGRSMKQWKVSLTSNGEDLGEVFVRRVFFQGDSLSPLLFVLSIIPLSLILRKVTAAYEWGKKEYKVNHLLFMDDLKLYAKTEDQMSMLVRTVHMFSNDIGMEFGMKKCGVLTLKRGKIVRSEVIKLADGQTMKEVQEEGYTYLGIVELDKIKEAEMKDTIGKEYKRRLRLVLRSKLNGKKKGVSDQHMGSGHIPAVCEKKRWGRGLISIERYVKDEESSLKVYVSKSEEKLFKGVAKFEELSASELEEVRDLKTRNENEAKDRWTGKRIHGQFVRDLADDVDKEKTWVWLSKCDLKVGESIQHIVSACGKLAQKEYKRRYDNVARKIHWDICKERGLECSEEWYEPAPEGVVESDDNKARKENTSIYIKKPSN
ncbi:uncharacterized protein LOC134785404 [Penaeus indicus]|uniref:uncharacterized protein LOC134785404 n=1 Tax=Penaeus indicus TaxID=29960 RepID=UPI00300CB752